MSSMSNRCAREICDDIIRESMENSVTKEIQWQIFVSKTQHVQAISDFFSFGIISIDTITIKV